MKKKRKYIFCVNLRDSGTESVSLAASPATLLPLRPDFVGVTIMGGAAGGVCVMLSLSLPPLSEAVAVTATIVVGVVMVVVLVFSVVSVKVTLTLGRSVDVELVTHGVLVVLVGVVGVVVLEEERFCCSGETNVSSVAAAAVKVEAEVEEAQVSSSASAEIAVVVRLVEDFFGDAAEAVAAAISAADVATQEVELAVEGHGVELCLFI